MLLPPFAAPRRPSPPSTVSMDRKPRGLDGVVAAQTRLSHVDGQAGELIIGGYQLRDLAGRVSFEEAAHLLWCGALPSRDELATLRREMSGQRAVPEETMRLGRAAAGTPPIDALRMASAAALRGRCWTGSRTSSRPTAPKDGCATSWPPAGGSWDLGIASTRCVIRAPTC